MQEQRRVVLAAPLVHDAAEPVGELLQVARADRRSSAQGPQPVVEVGARLLDEAVGAEQQGLARVEFEGGDRVFETAELGGQAQRQSAVHRHPAAAAVGLLDQRVDVAGPDELHHAGRQVGLGVEAGGEAVGVQLVQEGWRRGP